MAECIAEELKDVTIQQPEVNEIEVEEPNELAIDSHIDNK